MCAVCAFRAFSRWRPLVLGALAFQGGLASAGPAQEYLSEDFFPGMHILERASLDADEMRIYRRGQQPAAADEPLKVNLSQWKGTRQAMAELEKLIGIPAREPLQLPWAIFDAQGKRLKDLESLKQTTVAFLLEVGQWMWPAVRIGFAQQLHSVGEDGGSVLLRTLSVRPVVFEVADFMTPSETEAIMALGLTQGLHHSKGVMQSADLNSGKKDAEFRTSTQAWLDNSLSPLIAELDERTARLTRVPASHNEPVQLLRYGEDKYYHAHTDWTELELYPDQKQIWQDAHFGYQDRLATVFWYLNDVAEGGETNFPKFGQVICSPDSRAGSHTRHCKGGEDPVMSTCSKDLKVKPRRGSVILWYNFLATGRGDRNALHAGCPVGKNLTKWSGNKWVRLKPLSSQGRWIENHPAMQRLGWKGDGPSAQDPNACAINFINESGEDASLMWIDGDGKGRYMGTVKAGGTSSHKSFANHKFQMRSSKDEQLVSNVITCQPPSTRMVLDGTFRLSSSEKQEL